MADPKRTYFNNRKIQSERWYNKNNQFHRPDEPAVIYYYENGNIKGEYWYKNGQVHRLDGPAEIYYYYSGKIQDEQWYINGNEIKNPPYDNYPLTKEQIIEMKLTYG